MELTQQAILDQIDNLLAECEKVDGEDSHFEAVEVRSRIEAAIERLAPVNSPYLRNLKLSEEEVRVRFLHEELYQAEAVLKALRADYAAGHLRAITELIHADVFSDFLEMADYLLSEGYKDPAAVIAGTVLEGHLRKLCDKHSIPTQKPPGEPKKADALNAELAGANVYTKLDLKNVTAWLDLRNKAAHGHYAEYTKDQVALLIQSVRDFITRNPA